MISPEKRLWQAVITTALNDMLSSKIQRERDEARIWFERGGRDFRDVCHLAGMDPDSVRDKALSALERKLQAAE